MIENQFLLRDGRIRTDQFWNIVNIGFALKKLNWTEKFIQNHIEFLEKNEKLDVSAICSAMVSFHKNNYEEAIQKLAPVKFQNVLYGLYARCIQLKSYYELGDDYYQMFLNLTKSFYLFLNRNTLADETKLQFKNFIAFSKKLRNAKNKTHMLEVKGIREKLINGNVAYKSWLLSKLEELKSIKRIKKEKVTQKA